MNKIIVKQLVDFKNYLKGYYGENGIYAKTEFATETQIQSAIFDYYTSIHEEGAGLGTWGDGDSLDRERVAAILIDKYGVELY